MKSSGVEQALSIWKSNLVCMSSDPYIPSSRSRICAEVPVEADLRLAFRAVEAGQSIPARRAYDSRGAHASPHLRPALARTFLE